MNPSRLNANARRDQLLNVAIDVFGRGDYFGTSMNDIAEAAGVTKPVVYQHFDSKSDLYRALLDEVGTRLIASITEATAPAAGGKERTKLGFLAYFRWVADHHDQFMLLFGGSARNNGEFADQLQTITDQAAEAIAPLIDAEVDTDARNTLAHALIGLAEGASRRLIAVDSEFDPDEIAAQVSALAWAGLRALDKR
ncbi:MAG: hypothetical protein CSA55_05750 [Ilumatobacter coccineus]|uniref:HTH tetR-type domain-containing protein n=1 Tax=Ilumatobacter coccineus TaxID=467094 RepID=A0A2G6K6V3_9ACTN|nr:MAG: hypothetical protein CSA55_05750 [Ilumatobacter coccineus]